jgi:hypothetical protein
VTFCLQSPSLIQPVCTVVRKTLPALTHTCIQFRPISILYTSRRSRHKLRKNQARLHRLQEHDERLVVPHPEVANVRQLKVAHPRSALALCRAGLVLTEMRPPVVQQQHDHRDASPPTREHHSFFFVVVNILCMTFFYCFSFR